MSINEYLVCVVAAACVGILSDIIISNYSKRINGIDKYVKLAVSVCILACVFSPVIDKLDEDTLATAFLQNKVKTETVDMNESAYILEKECEDALDSYIFEKTGIKATEISIDIELKEGMTKPQISSARVVIGKDRETYSEEIIKAGKEALGMEVTIEYEE